MAGRYSDRRKGSLDAVGQGATCLILVAYRIKARIYAKSLPEHPLKCVVVVEGMTRRLVAAS